MMKSKCQSIEESRLDQPDWKLIRNRMQSRSTDHAVLSLAKVAEILGLSRQRVHEIETRAIRKLRHAFVREMPSLELRTDEYGQVRGLTETDYDSPVG